MSKQEAPQATDRKDETIAVTLLGLRWHQGTRDLHFVTYQLQTLGRLCSCVPQLPHPCNGNLNIPISLGRCPLNTVIRGRWLEQSLGHRRCSRRVS